MATGLTRHEQELILIGAGFGLVGGAFLGYAAVRNQMRTRYQEIAEAEIAEMQTHYDKRLADLVEQQKQLAATPKPNLDAMTKHLKDRAKAEVISEQEGYLPVEQEAIDEVEEETHNVFDERDKAELPKWDYDAELRTRSLQNPYVIHKDEFEEGPQHTTAEYEQTTLTYFEEDDVLCDERDSEIPSGDIRDTLVGEENLERFGHGSNDPNVVYIRNDARHLDIEICRSTGSFAAEVHGFIEHSDVPMDLMPRRFDDE